MVCLSAAQTDSDLKNLEGAKKMAEREGFEPSIPKKGITVFETAAFGHSAISPKNSL